MRLGGIADAVVELGHVARRATGRARFLRFAGRHFADQFTEAAEAAALFRNGDREQRFALFANLGAFGHETQPVEVHVGAAQNGRVGFAMAAMPGHVLLDGGHGECARRLDDAAGIDEHILDGCAHGVGVDRM
jgi:hypothetical protein